MKSNLDKPSYISVHPKPVEKAQNRQNSSLPKKSTGTFLSHAGLIFVSKTDQSNSSGTNFSVAQMSHKSKFIHTATTFFPLKNLRARFRVCSKLFGFTACQKLPIRNSPIPIQNSHYSVITK